MWWRTRESRVAQITILLKIVMVFKFFFVTLKNFHSKMEINMIKKIERKINLFVLRGVDFQNFTKNIWIEKKLHF